jgi:Rrf2 family iron-sulfur cluster assembly transcriptional regulator
VDATRCGGSGDCHDGRRCLTHELWAELSDQIHSFLSDISLADLVEHGRARQASAESGRSRETDVDVVLKGSANRRIDAV